MFLMQLLFLFANLRIYLLQIYGKFLKQLWVFPIFYNFAVFF